MGAKMQAVFERLENQAAARDELARRFRYLGGSDPATKASAAKALARRHWHEQYASDLRAVIAAARGGVFTMRPKP